jgi:hypothetical protein
LKTGNYEREKQQNINLKCTRHRPFYLRVDCRATSEPSFGRFGLVHVGHHVSDIERSIKFYEALDFKLAEGPSAWTVDKDVNKLGNTPGAESRTAVMKVQSSVSDTPFTFVLRQYRGVQRQDWGKGNTWDLLASHIDLTVDGSVSALLDKLEGQKLLTMPTINGLQNPRQQAGSAGTPLSRILTDSRSSISESKRLSPALHHRRQRFRIPLRQLPTWIGSASRRASIIMRRRSWIRRRLRISM